MSEEDENPIDGEEKVIDEDDKVEEEDEETVKNREAILKFQEDIRSGLSQISKTANNASYAYVRLNLAEKELERLYPPLLQYTQLRYLDLSGNQLSDITVVTELRYLLSLNVSKNQLTSLAAFSPVADEEILPYLQFLNLSGNKIQYLENVKLARLRKLQLAENEIQSCERFTGHPKLEILELRANKLRTLKGIANLPNLTDLSAEENELTHFKDLYNLPKLRNLILSKNKFKRIKKPIPQLPSLTYLNLSENEITVFAELLALKILSSTLTELTVTGNALDVEDAKKEILIFMRHFRRINEEDITKEDREDAENTLQERIDEAERQRKEQEEEAERVRKEQEEEAERLRKEQEEEAERLRKEQEEEDKKQAVAVAEDGAAGGGEEGAQIPSEEAPAEQ